MSSISSLFGYILNFIYSIVHNYGFAIIIFSVLIKLALLPLSIKQQKTMKKTAKIQGKVKELQVKYKGDQVKMNQEMMELYKKENLSPFSGCLSSILQIVFLFAIFLLVRNPLTYMVKLNNEVIVGVQKYIQEESQENVISQSYPQISILKYVSKNTDKTIEINKNEETGEGQAIELKDLYLNMNFIGMDLSNIPKENWNEPTVYIIPVLYVITTIISMKLTTKMTNPSKDKNEVIEIKSEDKEAKENSNQENLDMTAQMGKSMTWMMPVMSVSISLIAPLGLALYWLVNNTLMIAERLIINKLIKTEEDQNG